LYWALDGIGATLSGHVLLLPNNGILWTALYTAADAVR